MSEQEIVWCTKKHKHQFEKGCFQSNTNSTQNKSKHQRNGEAWMEEWWNHWWFPKFHGGDAPKKSAVHFKKEQDYAEDDAYSNRQSTLLCEERFYIVHTLTDREKWLIATQCQRLLNWFSMYNSNWNTKVEQSLYSMLRCIQLSWKQPQSFQWKRGIQIAAFLLTIWTGNKM